MQHCKPGNSELVLKLEFFGVYIPYTYSMEIHTKLIQFSHPAHIGHIPSIIYQQIYMSDINLHIYAIIERLVKILSSVEF